MLEPRQQGVRRQDLPRMDQDAANRTTPAWERPSWEEVVTEHSARVYRLAYRLTGNPHDAEDLTQEVFVRVFRSLTNYTPGSFEGWLYRITSNLFLDEARHNARIRMVAFAGDSDTRLRSRQPATEDEVVDRLLDGDVELALSGLPPEFRAAGVLCDLEGLSYDEIADVLGVKLGTVRSRIHRGRSMLRTALGHRAPAADRQRYGGPADVPAVQATM